MIQLSPQHIKIHFLRYVMISVAASAFGAFLAFFRLSLTGCFYPVYADAIC
jgi:hypothetical protein